METWCTKFYRLKTKEDVDLAVDKAVESGLINFDKKSWCIKRFRMSTIGIELFFAEGNTILNEQTIIQRRKHNKA
jgi:hypothetical protein